MTKWLNGIMEEAKRINLEKFRPMDEVGPGDHVVGEVDDECKKLYALAHTYKRRAAEIRGEACSTRFMEYSSKCRHLEKAKEMEQQAKAIMEIFQASVRDSQNLWGEDIAIRKWWTIVRIDITEIPNSTRFFAGTPFKAGL